MEVLANILDPVHPTLAPEVWEHPHAERPKLKRSHKEWIWHEVTTMLEAHGYHQSHEWLSLVLTGSLTTYQYSELSDCDVSLFVDSEVFPEWSRGEMIGLMVEHIDGKTLPGTPYAMQCFVIPKGLTKEDLYKPGLRSGYDLEHDEWIVPPDHTRSLDIEHQRNEAYVYAMECADKMERLLRYDPERAEDYWHQIHAARRRAQQEGRGDLSLPNIVYKFLANRGLFPRLSELTGEYIARMSAVWDAEEGRWVMSPEERAQIDPEIVHPHWAPTDGAFQEQRKNPEFRKRVPLVFDGAKVYLGNAGDLHSDIYENHKLPSDVTSWGMYFPKGGFTYGPGEITWPTSPPKPEWEEAIRHKLNATPGSEPEDPFGFNFASSFDAQSVLNANQGTNLAGLPGPVNVPGHGRLQFGGHADIQRIANEYNAQHGLGPHPNDYARVNPQHAAAVAQEYDRMPHSPQDPQVQQAYGALANEVRAQYEHAVKNGYNFDFYPETHDPYPNSPREAVLDLHHNKHMYVYPTEAGYGTEGEDPQDHPLLGDSGVRWGGKPVTHNDLFRAIHDFYGHAKEGLGFRADGEDNAYRQHAAMFSPSAQRALASETRGQNSWVNYGPHGEHNQTATSDTVYAPQKAGLLPEWASNPDLHRTAKTAAKFDPRIVAKFVYNPFENKLVLGEMAKEEGETLAHAQLRALGDIPHSHAHYGQVYPDGWTQTFMRPQLGVLKGMSPYESDYKLQKALDHVLPGAKLPGVTIPTHGKWDHPNPPTVLLSGQKPVIYDEQQEPHKEVDPFGFNF